MQSVRTHHIVAESLGDVQAHSLLQVCSQNECVRVAHICSWDTLKWLKKYIHFDAFQERMCATLTYSYCDDVMKKVLEKCHAADHTLEPQPYANLACQAGCPC